jgi:MerR family transcriptional regulator, light-induced transcriptional regulator
MQYFNIQVASQLSGVASATIRAWEKRYNAVVPERGENKHRLYSEKDIEKLALLFKLTEFGQSIGKIAHLDLEELKHVYATLMHRPYDEKSLVTVHHEKVNFEEMLTNFYLALAAYKIDIISHELEKAKALLGPRDLCLKILIPLFREIGIKVERGDFSVAQEHTLSAIVSFHVGHMVGLHYQQESVRDELILITTPEGELHELGILASSLLCIHYNYRFIFLGANLPAASLVEAATALKPKYILIGMSRGPETLDAYLDEAIEGLPPRCSIWMGGNLEPHTQKDLEKKGIPYFLSLEAFDEFLQKKS